MALSPHRVFSRRVLASYARPAAPLGAQRFGAPFHATARANVKVGDSLPDLEVLMESSPGSKVNLAKELGPGSGKAVIVGVPAAFSRS